jgi:Semialdehyde dehydrogenase, NAD binding domain
MKFTAATVSAAILLVAASSSSSSASAFAFYPGSSSIALSQRLNNAAFVSSTFSNNHIFSSSYSSRVSSSTSSSTLLSMSAGQPLSIGIVGATGAVGKEIRSCLAQRQQDGKIDISSIRIFGSERSAGKVMDGIAVELFDVDKARECDVVFLAVSGDFSKAHAKAITAGDDGAVCIDNSVRERKRTIVKSLVMA